MSQRVQVTLKAIPLTFSKKADDGTKIEQEVTVQCAQWVKPQHMLDELLEAGLKAIIGRASPMEGEEWSAMIKRLGKELSSSDYQFGQRGARGPRGTVQERGWLKFLEVLGHKEDGKAVSLKTLERAQQTLCRKAILEGIDPDKRKEAAANMAEHLAERFDAWKAEMETDPTKVGGFVQIIELMDKQTLMVKG